MKTPLAQQADYDAMTRAWKSRAPWYRRMTARIGLQGKLTMCFLLLVSLGMGSSCWMFVSGSQLRLNDIMGEQARQVSQTLSLASEEKLRHGNYEDLRAQAQDLIKSRNILFVGFLTADSKPVVLASRDLEFRLRDLEGIDHNAQSLLQVQRKVSPLFGPFTQVVSPVLSLPERKKAEDSTAPGTVVEGARLIGYVAVGISLANEESQLARINYMVVGIGCVILLLSLPLAYILVYRVFQPIRQLLVATQKITSGDLETRVAIHRPDIIGMLARSFNEMVMWVKQQQQELETANDKLEEANRDLEEKIEQRTAQLETANKRLSSEIAEKEDFLRAVSHDLNAPLRNISGMATMLLMKHKERFDEDIVHRLERIKKNVEVETDLISELLELSRIKTRRQKMEPVEINAMVNELAGVFEDDFKTRNIQLIVDSQLPVLTCERARLRQVFQNLIDNAIKYMGNGPKKEIHVGCNCKLTEAEFYVRDTGIGIEPEDIDKVFFIFRRGKSSAVQNISGKGVGLASVKSIIETYNGKIWVESTPRAGSTFRFTINGKFVPSAATGNPRAAGESGSDERSKVARREDDSDRAKAVPAKG
jgi:signal transduction histidine kinase